MIRRLEKEDINQVMKIWLETNIAAHDFVPENYWRENYEAVREMLPQAEVYIYETENGIGGFVGVMDSYVAGIFVKKKMQSKGIGKQLLDHVKRKKEHLELQVYQKNHSAVRFYQREQFKILSEDIDENTGEWEFLMVWKGEKKMAQISYRRAQESDAEKIVEFYNFVGGETSFLSFEKDEYPLGVQEQMESIRSLEGNPTNIMLMAMDGEEIAGIATINSSSKIKARHDGELGIVVAKKYQGQGIGTELIRQLIEWARGNKITTRISLDTRADNVKAVELYMKFGFVVEGCRKNSTLLDGVYYDLYVMGMML